jgi:hypothetical protein
VILISVSCLSPGTWATIVQVKLLIDGVWTPEAIQRTKPGPARISLNLNGLLGAGRWLTCHAAAGAWRETLANKNGHE